MVQPSKGLISLITVCLRHESHLLEVHVPEASMVSSFFPGISVLPRHCSACSYIPQNVLTLSVVRRNEKTTPVGVKLMRSQVLYRACLGSLWSSHLRKSNMLQTLL